MYVKDSSMRHPPEKAKASGKPRVIVHINAGTPEKPKAARKSSPPPSSDRRANRTFDAKAIAAVRALHDAEERGRIASARAAANAAVIARVQALNVAARGRG